MSSGPGAQGGNCDVTYTSGPSSAVLNIVMGRHLCLVYWDLTPQQQPGSYGGGDDVDDDDDEMSVSPVKET